MGKRPDRCQYCDGEGNSTAGGLCGFCDRGKPLDTQEDWDNSWGKIGPKMRLASLFLCVVLSVYTVIAVAAVFAKL